MKTKLYILATVAALSCGTTALFSQDAPPPPPPGGEGGRPPGGDGRPPGGPQAGADRIAEFIKKADADGDGKVSKEEFLNSTKKDSEDRFAKLDTNADGYADKAEVEEAGRKMRDAMNQRRPEGEGMRRPEGEGGGFRPRPGGEGQPGTPPPPGADGGFRRPEGGPRPEGFRRPEGGDSQGRAAGMLGGMMLQRMDKDGDGAITKEEFAAGNQENFDRMDENKDGKVTKEELEAMGRRMREQFGGGGRPGGEGGFRRPEGDGRRPRPEAEAPAPPKES